MSRLINNRLFFIWKLKPETRALSVFAINNPYEPVVLLHKGF
jgi:hypothetical protein